MKWFLIISAAVFVGNMASFTVEIMIRSDSNEDDGKTQVIGESTASIEARKVLESLGMGPANHEKQGAEIDPAIQAAEKKKRLIEAKAECDASTQKLESDNTTVNRMSKNRACQQVGLFMNQLEPAQ